MKFTIAAFVFLSGAMMILGAPMYQTMVRARRGVAKRAIPAQVFTSPCGARAAGSAPLHSAAPPDAYHFIPTHERYAYPYEQYYYRNVQNMEEPEILSFSDMDHAMTHNVPVQVPMERSYLPYSGHYGAPAAPSLGLFPGAAKSGCGIPLLFSCTPSIVPGQLGQAQPQYAGVHGTGDVHPAYRHPEYQYEMEAPAQYREVDLSPAVVSNSEPQEQQLPVEATESAAQQ